MYSIDLRLQARADGQLARRTVQLDGQPYEQWQLTCDQQSVPMHVSFEQAAARLRQLPRLFLEPDGALLWVSGPAEPAWQLEGCLYDRRGRVMYVELVGTCTSDAFDRLLEVFDWPRSQFVFQLRQYAVFLDEAQWRRFASCQAQLP